MIVILDSSDGERLKASYAHVYALMLADVIIVGSALGIAFVAVCLICCLIVCEYRK